MIPTYISDLKIKDYLTHDYYKKIAKYIKGKSVLDVGCVDEDILLANKRRLWNHWFIFSLAKKTIGIDIVEKSINTMKKFGFNAKTMSAEEMTFKEKFDVVFAGELIEHLPNPGLFLVKAKAALKPKGKIVLSTPNTYALNKIIRVIQFRTNIPPENPDHTAYFTPQNLETLAKKCNLKISKIDYAFFPFSHETLFVKLNMLLCSLLGDKFKEQIIVVLE